MSEARSQAESGLVRRACRVQGRGGVTSSQCSRKTEASNAIFYVFSTGTPHYVYCSKVVNKPLW